MRNRERGADQKHLFYSSRPQFFVVAVSKDNYSITNIVTTNSLALSINDTFFVPFPELLFKPLVRLPFKCVGALHAHYMLACKDHFVAFSRPAGTHSFSAERLQLLCILSFARRIRYCVALPGFVIPKSSFAASDSCV